MKHPIGQGCFDSIKQLNRVSLPTVKNCQDLYKIPWRAAMISHCLLKMLPVAVDIFLITP